MEGKETKILSPYYFSYSHRKPCEYLKICEELGLEKMCFDCIPFAPVDWTCLGNEEQQEHKMHLCHFHVEDNFHNICPYHNTPIYQYIVEDSK